MYREGFTELFFTLFDPLVFQPALAPTGGTNLCRLGRILYVVTRPVDNHEEQAA
jgi:hypothetical protein